MKHLSRLFPCFLPFLLCLNALAAAGDVVWDGPAADYIILPACVGSEPRLFPGLADPRPGDTFTERILITAAPGADAETNLYLCCQGMPEDSDSLLSQISLRIEGRDQRTVFSGTLEKACRWVYLGTFQKGQWEAQSIQLTLSGHAEDDCLRAVSGISWRFLAQERALTEDPLVWTGTDVLPGTGDGFSPTPAICILLGSALLLYIIIRSRRGIGRPPFRHST